MWALARFGKDHRPFREIFGMEFPDPTPENIPTSKRVVPRHAYVGLAFLVLGAVGAAAVGGRAELIPERETFASFPSSIGEWRGRNNTLDDLVLDVLKLDDYIISDYQNTDDQSVNFYVSYYASQRSGASAHSPRTCLPGGGWRIESHTQVDLGDGLRTNRFIIRMGESRQLVYYWFKQRDRIITDEFAVKWYILWDALMRNRTDGALIRLTTVIPPGKNIDDVEQRLREFARAVALPLDKYVPD
jgi:EpsI family protein